MPYIDPIKRKEYAKEYRLKYKHKAAEYQKAYREAHDATVYKHEWYKDKRFAKYGITKDIFNTLLDKQRHSCAICLIGFTEKTRAYIDHCHTNGSVRGLLCMNCNTGLGHFKDSTDLMACACLYLEGNK